MTNISQKNEILENIRQVWLENPKWRLGQLLANIYGHHTDPFYWRDELLEKLLKEYK